MAATLAAPLAAQDLRPEMWLTNGSVQAVLPYDGRVYIGGQFSWVGPPTGGGAALDAATGALTTGTLMTGALRLKGEVMAAVPDGSGGWYIGGAFTEVGGEPRRNLAQITASGEVTAWGPDVWTAGASGNNHGVVHALAVSAGAVYVGGFFSRAGSAFRNHLAAFDAGTGALLPWNPGANNTVHALAVSGGAVYAGGSFGNAGGASRTRLAAFDAQTGALLPWDPGVDFQSGATINALAASGGAVYAGGAFRIAGDAPRSGLAAFDAQTGTVLSWDPSTTSRVFSLAVSGGVVYAGGDFRNAGGAPRNRLAAFDEGTGALLLWDPGAAWSPTANVSVYALAVSGGTVYAGGNFQNAGGATRLRLAAFDAGTGALLPWDPGASGSTPTSVRVLAASGDALYAGGFFAAAGGAMRSGLAAFDDASGALLPWDPGASNGLNGVTYALAGSGGRIYAGGWYNQPPNLVQFHLAALDPETGALLPWNAGRVNNTVYALAVSGGTVYAGGNFTSVGTDARSRLAAFDGATGALRSWSPSASGTTNGAVFSLAASGGVVYAGGTFTSVAGASRSRLAALDAATGALLPWNPGASGLTSTSVDALAASGGTVYAGGGFSIAGGASRNRLAAFDGTTGDVLPWNPGADGRVRALAATGDAVYAGGEFWSAGGASLYRLVALDPATGAVLPWNPDVVGGNVYALATVGSALYAGGSFPSMGGEARGGLAAFGNPTGPPTAVPPVSASVAFGLEAPYPNPALGGERIRLPFTLAEASAVRIAVYDLVGREVARLVEGPMEAGRHEATWDGRSAARGARAAGVYVVRMEAGAFRQALRVTVVD